MMTKDLSKPNGLLGQMQNTIPMPVTPPQRLIVKSKTSAPQQDNSQPGDRHHFPAMAELERHIWTSINLEDFYKKLDNFIETRLPAIRERRAPSRQELLLLDDFVENYFRSTLPEIERWIARGFVLSQAILQADLLPVQPELPKGDIPVPSSQREAVAWAQYNAAKHVTNAAAQTKDRIAEIVAETIRNRGSAREIRQKLKEELFDDAHELNRNWKRVAITEANAAMSNGYLANLHHGEWVIGFSFPDACSECKLYIDGKAYLFIEPQISLSYPEDKLERSKIEWIWENCVWVGKDNVGRRRSVNKRTENGLRPRDHDELWMPSIPMHPNCRCRWVRINPQTQYVANGMIKIRVANEAAWRKWYEEEIEPREKLSRQYLSVK